LERAGRGSERRRGSRRLMAPQQRLVHPGYGLLALLLVMAMLLLVMLLLQFLLLLICYCSCCCSDATYQTVHVLA
jgi:hypothetical protein